MLRSFIALVTTASLCLPAAQAAPLISFTDTSSTGNSYFIGDSIIYRAVGWTQTLGVKNAVFSAIVDRIVGADPTAQWWLTRKIGVGAVLGDVVANGTYTFGPQGSAGAPFFLNDAPYTTIATGIDLSPGTYFMVLAGPGHPTAPYGGFWFGDRTGTVDNLAAGFSAVRNFVAGDVFTREPLDAFAPAAAFETMGSQRMFFRLDGVVQAAEPATLALLGAGLLGLVVLRRRPHAA